MWGPSSEAGHGGCPVPFPSQPQALPGAEVGGHGEDAGQGGDDAAHVGEESQILLVDGVHLHGGDLGPQGRSGLASVLRVCPEGGLTHGPFGHL